MKQYNKKKRQCTLMNYKTGQVISSESISEFCRLAELKDNDKFHFTPVLNGERSHHKNWARFDFLNSVLQLKDVYNNKYTDTVLNFLTKHKLSIYCLFNLSTKRKKIANNLLLQETEIPKIPSRSFDVSNYKFINPKNKIVSLKSIRTIDASKEVDISYHSLWSLSRGHAFKVKGYKFVGCDVKHKKILE